jgi:hypothetical protein
MLDLQAKKNTKTAREGELPLIKKLLLQNTTDSIPHYNVVISSSLIFTVEVLLPCCCALTRPNYENHGSNLNSN